MERRGLLYIVSAPSGTGKTTLCKQIVASVPGVWHSVSYTTRQPRPGEEHGREYFFTDQAAFQGMIDRQEFVEWARVYDQYYGTPRKPIVDSLDQGIDVLLEIDTQGAAQIRKKFDDTVSIYILPPSLGTLRTRLTTRAGDSADEIARRLQKAREEVWSYRDYTYLIRNDDLTQSLKELESVFWAERIRTKRVDIAWLESNFILDKDEKEKEISTR
ncbi:MAG: guanylate kinase [Nitrospiraceae bacterium]